MKAKRRDYSKKKVVAIFHEKAADRTREIKNIWLHESDFDRSCFGAIYFCHSTKSALVISLLKMIINSNLK